MTKNNEKMLKGIAVSPGIAIGRVFIWASEEYNITRQQIKDRQIPVEIVRFEEALIKTRSEILEIQRKISKEMVEISFVFF